jgi:hypothetical protein
MQDNKVKTLGQVVEEFHREGEEELPNFKTRLASAQDRLAQLRLDAEMQLPQGVVQIEINDILCFNYSVQRDLRPSHVLRICEKFDPRVVRPASAVKRGGKFYLFDGQHTSVALAVLGYTSIPMTWVETSHQSFDAVAFEILNDTGILRAGTEEIHRGLLHRWNNDPTAANDRNNPRVKIAYAVDTLFKRCSIDLEPKRVRKSSGKCGPNKHYFSHFDYAYKGLEMTGDMDVLERILLGVKKYYGDEDGGEINQGLYIGLVKMYALAKEDGSTKFLPQDWVGKILEAMIKVCGRNANGIHSAAKKQWQHTRGTSWDAPVAMSTLMREVYVIQAPEQDLFNPPHEAKVSMGIMTGDICNEFKPYFKKAA